MEWNGMEWKWNGWNGSKWNGMEWNGMEWKIYSNDLTWNGMGPEIRPSRGGADSRDGPAGDAAAHRTPEDSVIEPAAYARVEGLNPNFQVVARIHRDKCIGVSWLYGFAGIKRISITESPRLRRIQRERRGGGG